MSVREAIDAAHTEAVANGHADPEDVAHIPGQQSIDGREIPADPVPPVDEIRVDGTTQLGFFDVGGKRPAAASLRLTGGKVPLVEGTAFKKGDTISFQGTAVVDFVGQQDKTDSQTGIVVSAEQQHRARIIDLRVD